MDNSVSFIEVGTPVKEVLKTGKTGVQNFHTFEMNIIGTFEEADSCYLFFKSISNYAIFFSKAYLIMLK